MTEYSFSGAIQQGRQENPFQRNISAESKEYAEDILYAELGSEHGVTRSKITIENVEEVE